MNTTNEKPALTIDGLTFFPVPEFSKPEQAFGAAESRYFNRYKLPSVPRKYEDMVQSLFFNGGSLPEIKPEVDKAKAIAATQAWLLSFAPAHEAKISTVAYAFWVWCEGDLSNQNT